MTDTITITRDTRGYYLSGRYGGAEVITRWPLSAEHVGRHLRGLRRARIIANLPAGDPLLARLPRRRGSAR